MTGAGSDLGKRPAATVLDAWRAASPEPTGPAGRGAPPLEQRRIRGYVTALTRIFKTAADKREAHQRSRQVLQDISTDRSFLKTILRRYLQTPGVLNTKNYPTVEVNVELNAFYHLVANCWIPRPGRETDVSSKCIHHHGNMLLTTLSVFGPGYEHWLFTRPRELDPARELYAMDVVERKRHAVHNLAFVDAWTPHLPVYPERLSVTLCLWSSQHPTGWKDYLKRVAVLKRNEAALRRLAARVGLAKPLDLKIVSYFDYYPTAEGFRGMRQRIEFARGPNEDHLHSVFHVLQATGNDDLVPVIEQQLGAGRAPLANPALIRRLAEDLRRGRRIEGRLSACHLYLPHATFTTGQIEQALAGLRAGGRPAAGGLDGG